MNALDTLSLTSYCPVKAQNAGLFIARGGAMHPTRIINSHELIFVKQGELDMWEEDREFHLEAGQTLHLYPGRQHGSTKPLPLGLSFYWIHFEVEPPHKQQSMIPANDYSLATHIPQVARCAHPERLERLFRTFLDDQEAGVLQTYSANLLLLLILIEATQFDAEVSGSHDDLNVVAAWAHSYIRMNYDQPITTSKVAEALGYSADYLGRIYREAYGHTLTEGIHRRRVTKACSFLMDASLTIEQIAHQCGFNDSDYFGRIFRRYMKVSPAAYRKEYSLAHTNTH